MTQNQVFKTVATPINRVNPQLKAFREAVARLDYKRRLLNKSQGKYYREAQRVIGVIEEDSIELFTNINTGKKAESVEKTRGNALMDTIGFTYRFIGLEKDEQTVQIRHQKVIRVYDPELNIFSNSVIDSHAMKEMDVKEFGKVVVKMTEIAQASKNAKDFTKKIIEMIDQSMTV